MKAIFFAIIVVILWSTSWILIKIAVEEVPSLTLAGLRYTLAFLALIPFISRQRLRNELTKLSRKQWLDLIWLGILFIALTQGAMYIALSILPAVTTSLILNFTSALIAILGIFFLKEKPTLLQWFGLIINLIGILIYFIPFQNGNYAILGYFAAITCLIINSYSALLSRNINRDSRINPIIVTWVSIGVGGILLLGMGLIFQGIPKISMSNTLIILWLGIMNTAVAFPLWNLSLQSLTAMESSMINSLMLIFIAILAIIFLDEKLNGLDILGLTLAASGTFLVQLRYLPGVNQQTGI